MADENIVDDVVENNQPETKEEKAVTVEEAYQLAKATQKGYTQQQQVLSEIRESVANLQSLADKVNAKTGAEKGEDEYVTVGKLRDVLKQYDSDKEQRIATEAERRQKEADNFVNSQLDRLEELGAIKESDRKSLCQYALDHQESDLREAYIGWSKLSEQDRQKQNQSKAKVERKDASSLVGSSSKTSAPDGKIDYAEILRQRGSF